MTQNIIAVKIYKAKEKSEEHKNKQFIRKNFFFRDLNPKLQKRWTFKVQAFTNFAKKDLKCYYGRS